MQAVKEQLVQYFIEGEKKKEDGFILGVELEHFIVYKDTKEAVSYYGENGIEALLKELSVFYPKHLYEDERLVGMVNEEYYITLEPAAQIEISILPQKNVVKIEEIYNRFKSLWEPILEKYNYKLVSLGYQPISKVNDLDLIPKERYRLMDFHFSNIGEYGRQMMRGTASTQISIDYFSQEDFSKKYKLAYILSPIMMFLYDTLPIYEGEKNETPMFREHIWKNVDKKRIQVFREDSINIDYATYANFVLQAPMIVRLDEKNGICYEKRGAGECYTSVNEEQIEHILSMVFPMVRLKHFIEIRYGDGMEFQTALSYITWIKGLFIGVDEALAFFESLEIRNYKQIADAFEELRSKKMDANIYGMNFTKIVEKIYEIGKKYIEKEEIKYLSLSYLSKKMKEILDGKK